MLLNYLSFGPNRNSLDAFHNHIGDKSDFNARKQINMGSYGAAYRSDHQCVLM